MLPLFLLLVSPPVPFALMPFLSLSLANLGVACPPRLRAAMPTPIRDRLAYLSSSEGVMQVHAFGAVSELIVASMLPVLSLITRQSRLIALTLFWLQYVVRRTRTNQLSRQALDVIVAKADSLLSHRLVPSMARSAFDAFKTTLSRAATTLVV